MEGCYRHYPPLRAASQMLLLFSLVNTVQSTVKTIWSQWFDEPRDVFGDNQTLRRIRQMYGYSCPLEDIQNVQCRLTGNEAVFSRTEWYLGNHLSPPCDLTGVACTLLDQPLMFAANPCFDYEIRFQCRFQDSTSSTTELQNPLSVHGGFIALAAGLSVVVPLICVLIVQLRRAKREEQNRAATSSGDGNERCAEGLTQPPPAYEELFGPGYEPQISAMHSRFNSTDVLIDEAEGGVRGVTNPIREGLRDNIHDYNDSGNDTGDSGGENTHFRSREDEGGRGEGGRGGEASIATISGNGVTDVRAVSGQQRGDDNGNSGEISNSRVVSLDVSSLDGHNRSGNNNVAGNNSCRSHSNSNDTSNINSSSPTYYQSFENSPSNSRTNLRSTSSTHLSNPRSPESASSSTFQPGASPSSPTTSSSSPPPPPPPPSSSLSQFPSSSTQTNHNQTPSRYTPSTNPTVLPNSSTRFPSMHISIQDILSALREQSDRAQPPPSYQEALKILEKAEKEKKKKKKISK